MKINVNKNLGLLLSGQFVSQVGDKFYLLALSYWVLKTTGSPAKMGIVLACSLLPSLLLGFISGAFIDRYSRKTIIVGTDAIRGVVIGLVTLAYMSGVLSFPIIIVSQVLLSINAAFFDPAIPTVIPQVVETEKLAKANSMTQLIQGLSTIVGPVLGGIAVAGFGYTFAFAFNSVSFLISALFECFLTIPKTVRGETKKTSVKEDILAGYRYILADKGLKIILITVGVIHFFVGSMEVVIPVLADTLTGEGARNMGFLQTAFGVGAVLSALLISAININGKETRLLFSAVFVVGLGYILLTVLHFAGFQVVVPFLLVFLGIGGFIVLAGTCFKTLLQKNIDDKMMGRVFGVVSSVGNGSIPLAMLIYGYLLVVIDVYHLVLVTGLLLLPLCIISYNLTSEGDKKAVKENAINVIQ